MAKFRVEYTNGDVEEVEQSDCATVDAFINTKFGSAPAAKVTLVGTEKEQAEEQAKPRKK